ncbi:MAG: hypothetical protein Q4D36_03680 [Bacteroidales bacterium]|nr:hypothetical protein [Bacteroidales bacterium]
MNTVISADETMFSTVHPDIEKRTSVSSVLVSAIFCVIGAGAFVTSLKMGDSSSTMSMAFMTGGTILFLLAVFRLFWKSKEWVYVPTGSVAKERTCFFDECDLQALAATLESKDFTGKNDVKAKSCGNVRMDYMLSQDKRFVAVQLFRFVPYTYEPASSVFYYTGAEAGAFVRCLEASKF